MRYGPLSVLQQNNKANTAYGISMITVLGAGLVGSAIIQDLSADFDVTAFDKSRKALDGLDIRKKYSDDIFSRRNVLEASEIVVTTLPGSISYAVVKKLLRMGKAVVDTSFMEEDPFTLDETARRHRAIYVPDAGYAPGATNILSGRMYKKERVKKIEIIVAGLPVSCTEPFRHAVTFNVEGLIDEYTRPARIMRAGKVETVDPLSEISAVPFSGSMYEAFYSDGLRTLLRTVGVEEMFEKTLRYPGHLQAMKQLRDFGYFSNDKVDGIVPRKLTESLFGRFGTDFRDMCLTRVTGFNERKLEYTNVDRYDRKTGTKSMARMTGYSAAAMARILAGGMVDAKGVYPPEYFGFFDREFDTFIALLRKRGIRFSYTET